MVEELEFFRNRILAIESKVFLPLINLKWLLLGDNQIVNIASDLFHHLNKLERLHLGENQIN
jgi:Leucine-rich repeat (LRR) protein